MFDKIKPPFPVGERLKIRDILPKDKKNYYTLYTDEEQNKFWGYDYKQDLKNQTPSADYFYNLQLKLKEIKEEYSFAVTYNDEMIGEVVLHNFKNDQLETGIRILKNYQKNGYGYEALCLLISYVKSVLNPNIITSKCYKENTRSEGLLKKCGFKEDYRDETYIHFKIYNY